MKAYCSIARIARAKSQRNEGELMKITVMHVMNSITPTSTGFELASRLDPEKFNTIIVSFAGTVQINDPRIISLNAKSKLSLKGIAALNRIMRKSKVDIIHTHHNISGSIARILAKLNRIPVIVDTEHGSHSRYKLAGNLFNDLSLFLSDIIINVSQWVNSSYALWERFLVPQSRMCVIYNGVDLAKADMILESGPKSASIRSNYSISEDDIFFLHAARLTGVKNQLKLINGFARAAAEHPEARLVIAGDGELRDALHNLVEELDISKNVIFTGLLSRQDTYCLMKAADGFVMNSLSEGMSVALLEAMAFSLPCILSDIPSFRETTRGVDIGEFIERDDEESVKKAFMRFIETDKSALKLKGKRARELAWSIYSIESTVRSYESIYMELLSSKKVKLENKRRIRVYEGRGAEKLQQGR